MKTSTYSLTFKPPCAILLASKWVEVPIAYMATRTRKTQPKYALFDKLASTIVGLGILSAIPNPAYAQAPKNHISEQAAIDISKENKIVVASSNRQRAKNTEQETKTYPVEIVSNEAVWDKLAGCESGGNWHINTSNGYYGGVQFSLSTWQSVGGTGLPSDVSREEQITRAKILQQRSGWGQWPACARQLGLL